MACQGIRNEWFPRGKKEFKIQSSLLKGENQNTFAATLRQ